MVEQKKIYIIINSNRRNVSVVNDGSCIEHIYNNEHARTYINCSGAQCPLQVNKSNRSNSRRRGKKKKILARFFFRSKSFVFFSSHSLHGLYFFFSCPSINTLHVLYYIAVSVYIHAQCRLYGLCYTQLLKHLNILYI